MKLKVMIATMLVSIGMLSCSSDDGGTSVDSSCEDATSASLSAAMAYNNATDAESAVKCVAYKAALQAQIVACGDASGALQLVINSLGDCSDDAITGSITVTVGSAPRTFNKNMSITPVGITQHVYAEDSAGYFIEFDLAVNATGTTAIQNFNIHLITKDYTPLSVNEGGNWTSNITVNSDTKITGVFNGYVSSSDNATLDLTSGIINLNF